MKTPVIIAAYNEAERIGATLGGLDVHTTEPFVIVNGYEGQQETVTEASRYTPNVFVSEAQGKLPAVQLGLRKLLEYDTEAFAKPILFTDADSHPLRKKLWAPTLSRVVAGPDTSSAAGVALFNDGPFVDLALRNVRRLLVAHRHQKGYNLQSVYGSNLAVNFAGNAALIDEVLSLPHIWPAEDRYLAHIFAGDDRRFTQLTDLNSAVVTSGRYLMPLQEKLFKNRLQRQGENTANYAARRADSVTHYFNEFTSTLHEYETTH